MSDPVAMEFRQDRELRFIHELTKKALGLESLTAFWPILENSLVGFFGCARASLYLVEKAELRSMFARGLEQPVVLKLGDGIAGTVALGGWPILVNAPYADHRFNAAYDRISGYKTESLACAAFVHENASVGVVELLNKPGGFGPDDEQSLRVFSPHIGFIIAKLLSDQKNRELQSRLAQVGKMATLGMLVGGVAHELGTPLTAMEAHIHKMLGSAPPGSEQHERLEQLRAQVLRCHRLAKDLLGFARRSEFKVQDVSIGRTFEAVLPLAVHQARLQGVEMSLEAPEDLPEVKAGPDQLQQVFLNLIINALQAMRGGGRLRITAAVRDGRVEVAFADDGEGIEGTDLAQIFEPFFTTRSKGQGTGLGLSICKDLVEKCGGTLTAASEGKGKGAVFTVLLPSAL